MKYGALVDNYGRFHEERYTKMKAHGFDCADYGMARTDTKLYTGSDEEVRAILLHEKTLAAEAGITFSQVHGPWRWPSQDATEEDRAERMEKMQKSIRNTALLGCKNWVIHPIMPFGIQEKNDPETAKKTWDINRQFMRKLLKTAKEHDITICLENMPMPEFSLGDPSAILQFVQEMNDDHFQICLDTGHVAVCPGFTVGDAVRALGSHIRTLHVHDNDGRHDLHQLPFFGVIDWKDFGAALKEIAFDGSFSFETCPSNRLPTPLFDEMSYTMAKIGREIMGEKYN